MGADLALNPDEPDTLDQLMATTDGGVHASIVLAESQGALNDAALFTKKHGVICLVAAVSRVVSPRPVHAVSNFSAQTTVASIRAVADSQRPQDYR